MTYHYRIYTFQNGLGETIFRVKPICRFWPQWATLWMEAWGHNEGRSLWSYSTKWDSRDGALYAVDSHVKKRSGQWRYRLVAAEDKSVEIP